MQRAVAYLRTNDGDRAKIAAQRTAIEAWAERTRTPVIGWFIDAYESASTAPLDRPSLRDALATASQPGIVFIVSAADRLSRSTLQVAHIASLLQCHGASLKTVDGHAESALALLGTSVLEALH